MTTLYDDYLKDRNGWFFGLTGAQLAVLLFSGVPVWLTFNAARWAWLLVWVPVWLLTAALVTVPVRGFSALQWLAVLMRHSLGAVFGWSGWRSRVEAGELDVLDEVDLPGVLSGLDIHTGPPFGHHLSRVAVIQDSARRTWAATARIEHPGLGLTEGETRDRMGSGLAELCEAATRAEAVSLVALQVRTVPDDGAEREDWVRRHRHPRGPELARRINEVLAAQLMPASVRTESFVTVVISEDRLGRSAKRSASGVAGRAHLLYGALGEIEARLLGSVGCTRVTWLDTPGIAQAIRTGYEPGDRASLVSADLAARTYPRLAAGVPLGAAGPTRAETDLRQYRHGDWVTLSDTVLLPAQGAPLGALAPVLVPTEAGERRALTVFLAPVGAREADRLTSREEMSAITGAEMRRRTGRLERAKERRAVGRVRGADEKLARGRSLVRVSAAISVTVPRTWPGAEFGRRLDAAVRMAGYVPVRLDGAQDAAFVASTIPVGVGPHR